MSGVGKIRLVVLLLLSALVWLIVHKDEEIKLPSKVFSRPIKYVRTEGVFQYLGKDEIKSALEPLVSTGFFEADMQAIHLAVAKLPWVESVAVKRIWPDAIDIKIKEKKPYVRWGRDSLMTEQGVIFTPKSIDQQKHLTILNGPAQQQTKVLEIMKGIKTALADQSLELAEFTVNDRWAWKIKLTTGLEIQLGREEQLKKLQRFLKTLAVLGQEQVDAMAIVDLRYPNGYAVSWKPGNPEIDWQSIANPQIETEDQAKEQ